jgi:molybdenum cofactor biosynthesis protein A
MLTDRFGREHNYLRISLTERCNLRCFYCMPADGIKLSAPSHLMQADEIEKIAKTFVQLGVKKIRLTGGEPLVRKDFETVYKKLHALNVELAITTNGILIDQYLELFKSTNLQKINVSLDTLEKKKFAEITRRDYFDRVWKNIESLVENNITPKVNVVLMKGVNDNEICDFIALTKKMKINIQFIEFMPFNGNQWDWSKGVSYSEIIERAHDYFGENNLMVVKNSENSTSRNFKIKGHKGNFGIVSTVTNPFCDSCNRIRLTANGKIKNCLFSGGETNLLSALRQQEDIVPLIMESILNKKKERGGKGDFQQANSSELENNRSMVLIGG